MGTNIHLQNMKTNEYGRDAPILLSATSDAGLVFLHVNEGGVSRAYELTPEQAKSLGKAFLAGAKRYEKTLK